MANRYSEKVVLDGEKLEKDIKALAGSQEMFAKSIGISQNTVSRAIAGSPLSLEYAEKITRGMFKPQGYYHKREASPEVGGGSTGNTEKILLGMGRQQHMDQQATWEILEDIKQSNESIYQQLKTLTTLQARLLALWEGKENEKGN